MIIPDFGGGFGGKHSGECAVEAARLAKAAGKPVRLVWTRAEEFTWAQFRPAAVIDAEASLDADGQADLLALRQHQLRRPTRSRRPTGRARARAASSRRSPPLRHGSYRALAATANTFGRECFMDELADAAGRDPLEFRLAHLEPGRLRDVLEEAARRFDWAVAVEDERSRTSASASPAAPTRARSWPPASRSRSTASRGRSPSSASARRTSAARSLNPANLLTQVKGAIVMALGPALREEMRFEGGKMLNASFGRYRVPRFADVPELDIHLLDRPDLPSAGAGETPLIAVAPAIANAVFAATGVRVRSMPIRLPGVPWWGHLQTLTINPPTRPRIRPVRSVEAVGLAWA